MPYINDRRAALSALKDMPVTDCSKDGKCSGCGECCTNLLPMTAKEIDQIGKYIRYKKIEAVDHRPALAVGTVVDLCCPFLDTTKPDHKCLIYPVRPEICRDFFCHYSANGVPSKIPMERMLKMLPVHVRETFYGQEN